MTGPGEQTTRVCAVGVWGLSFWVCSVIKAQAIDVFKMRPLPEVGSWKSMTHEWCQRQYRSIAPQFVWTGQLILNYSWGDSTLSHSRDSRGRLEDYSSRQWRQQHHKNTSKEEHGARSECLTPKFAVRGTHNILERLKRTFWY